MIRILFTALIIGITIFIINSLLSWYRADMCTNCNGQGFWLGTRGEKNHCKTCDGTGRQATS